MKTTVTNTPADRRVDARIIQRNLLRGDARLRLFHGGGGDIALHPGVIDIVAADGVIVFQLLIAGQQLLGLTQRSLRAFQLGPGQRQRSPRLGIIEGEQPIAFPDVLPVLEVALHNGPLRACADLHVMNRFNAAGKRTFSHMRQPLNDGRANRDGGRGGGRQGVTGQAKGQADQAQNVSHRDSLLAMRRPSPERRGAPGGSGGFT